MMLARAPHRSWPEQAGVWLSSVAVIIIIGAVVTALATAFAPITQIAKLNIRVIGSPVAGEGLVVELDYCKVYQWTPADVRWSLVNEVTVVLHSTRMSMPVGCHVKRLAVALPAHVAPGQYVLQEELFYRPWPWRELTYVAQSPSFTLQAPKEAGR